MKYILCHNTSYTRNAIYIIRELNEYKRCAIYRGSHIKPILISTNEQLLKLVMPSLKKEFIK